MKQVFSGAQVFDGTRLLSGHVLTVENGVVTGLEPGTGGDIVLDGGVLAPAFVDLHVRGGGGIALDGDIDVGQIAAICATHILLGCAGVLPTLTSATAAATAHVIEACIMAAQANVPGFLGLHLDGPHLDPAAEGSFDRAHIRPMGQDDLDLLLEAARHLPVLMITVAPASVTVSQVAALAQAGVLVSLGRSTCSHAQAMAYRKAGACCVTQLFNAMAAISGADAGLAGAVLDSDLAAGVIADGRHLSDATLRIALKTRENRLFLVSDATSAAGTHMAEGGAEPGAQATLRRLDGAVRHMVRHAGITAERSLAMATSAPAAFIGMDDALGHLLPQRRADMIYLDAEWKLARIWWGGVPL